ncbi:hypothetical protein SLS63_011278 [Diaporthe eres]|uniref:Uncharacterized protein n=1 Tax=Diaporthe eres TaxID=83184 RepID=A0ABR1NUD9_DIAER
MASDASKNKPQTATARKPASSGPSKPKCSHPKPQKPANASKAALKQMLLSKLRGPVKKAAGGTAGQKQAAGGTAGQKQAADGKSSRVPSSSTPQPPGKSAGGNTPRQIADSNKKKSGGAGDDEVDLYITLYIFNGNTRAYYDRHVLTYFTKKDDPSFHEIVHVERDEMGDPYRPVRFHTPRNYLLSNDYCGHVNAGTVRVKRGQEMKVVDIAASVDVEGKELDSGWNCQHYVLEGLQKLVDHGYKQQGWYNSVENELFDSLLDGAT